MNNIAEAIRQTVTMTEVCKHYGFTPNRAGFIHCPFHPGDRDASLKIYPNNRGWNCFGCGKGGSVIDFVKELCGAEFNEAIRIIDNEFGLGLFEKPTLQQYRRMQKINRERDEQCKKYEKELSEAEKEWQVLCAEFRRLHFNKIRYAPTSVQEEWHPLFIEALRKIDYLEYLLEQTEKRIEVIKNDRRNYCKNDLAGAVAK